jgi:hypothetical protein
LSPRLLNDLVAAALHPAYRSITLNFFLSDGQKLAMPRGGSKPGERRGSRQKGTPNKLSVGRMKAQLAVSAPEFDPYDQLETIAKTFLEQAHAEKQRDRPNARFVYDLLDKAGRQIGAVASGNAPPYNLSGDTIEKAISAHGFQLWRVKPKMA